MKLGIVGLGRMGLGIATRLVQAGHEVIGFDYNQKSCQDATVHGVAIVSSLQDIAKQVSIVWLMIPSGDPIDQALAELQPHVTRGSIIVDGGNSKFTDSIRRAQALSHNDIFFVDCGTSGGLTGAQVGYCLMVGGAREAYEKIEPLLCAIATTNGYAHVGPSGAGHYVKMVHNGIEYALMQSYAEGFQVLREGSFADVPLDLDQICALWNSGSIIRSWLLELTHQALATDQSLSGISGFIDESGMGLWTAQEAHTHNIPVPALDQARAVREWSRETGGNYATKLIAMMRLKMGGHAVKKSEQVS